MAETFRQFAPVKNVFLVRDLASRMSRGIAFVEYHSTDYATHALNNSQHLQMDRTTLKVNYAKEAFIQSIPAHQQQQRMMMMVQQVTSLLVYVTTGSLYSCSVFFLYRV